MMKTRRTFWLSLLTLLLLAPAWTACEGGEDEQAVMSVVTDGVSLLENTEIKQALRFTTSDFIVQPGRLDKQTTLRRMASFYHATGAVEILYPTPDVEIRDSGTVALVTAPFVVAKRSVSQDALDALEALSDDPEAWEEKAADYTAVEHAELSFVKENNRWLISSVRF